jgi:hypothetical protein
MLLITCPKKTELPDKTFNIKKLSMKTIIGVIILVVVIGGIVSYKETSLPVYHKEVTEVTTQEKVVEKVDVITEAKKELERINAELDAKEQELLKEKEAIELELERLRETRVNFQ